MFDHAKHETPHFGCEACIEQRDWWKCACEDWRLSDCKYCRVCGTKRSSSKQVDRVINNIDLEEWINEVN